MTKMLRIFHYRKHLESEWESLVWLKHTIRGNITEVPKNLNRKEELLKEKILSKEMTRFGKVDVSLMSRMVRSKFKYSGGNFLFLT